MLLRHVQSALEIQALLSAYCTRNVSAMSVARTRGRQPCRTCTADIRGHGLYPKLEWRGYFIGATDQSGAPCAFWFSCTTGIASGLYWIFSARTSDVWLVHGKGLQD